MLRMWMYDLAREQCPTHDHLRRLCDLTLESGYDALGIYLEHRFRYPSAPWAAGVGTLEPETVRKLQGEFKELKLVPFINTLGHFEGFLYTERGHSFAEEVFKGMQACPSNERFVELAKKLIDDTIDVFASDLIHIGGDETKQLGCCPQCAARLDQFSAPPKISSEPHSSLWVVSEEGGWGEEINAQARDGKAKLYGEHLGPLALHVIERGRRPAVWGDMFLEHPQALEQMPRETLIFDWQYFGGCKESSSQFKSAGFEVVACPTLQTYDAAWFHLLPSEQNVRMVVRDAQELQLAGVCVTTWECGLFGAYDTLFPAIRASAQMVKDGVPTAKSNHVVEEDEGMLPLEFMPEESLFLKAYSAVDERYEVWARMLSEDLRGQGGIFELDGWRSRLKSYFLMQSNPFLLWLHHREQLCGKSGDEVMALLEQALKVAPDEATKGVTLFVRSALEFVRIAQDARLHYAAGETEAAIAKLALTRKTFDDLVSIAAKTHERIGGSLADKERAKIAKEHIERVIVRIRRYGDGSLGYIPSFEHLSHPKFVPHDQAAWWLINDWAHE